MSTKGNGSNPQPEGGSMPSPAALSGAPGTSPSTLRSLVSTLLSRLTFGREWGFNTTFGSRRDLNLILGYDDFLDYRRYRNRYDRGGIAKRIVDIFPLSTWGNGFEIIEDQNLKRRTPFEKAVAGFMASDSLNVLSKIIRADIQARIGHFSCILIGAPSSKGLDSELDRGSSWEDIAFLMPLSEDKIKVQKLVGQNSTGEDKDAGNPRFGLPEFYQVNLGHSTSSSQMVVGQNVTMTLSKTVHWSRVIHIAHGLLDNEIYGQPFLQPVWNDLDNLVKTVGGGAEAFLRRAWPGLHADLDKEFHPSDGDIERTKEQLYEYNIGLTNGIQTQGVNLSQLSSNGNIQFGPNAGPILDLICGTLGISKERLIGSELGLRSSEKNDESWNKRVGEEQNLYCEPVILKQLLSRLVTYGYFPTPRNPEYEVRWPKEEELSETEKGKHLLDVSQANKYQTEAGDTVFITSDEIREKILGLDPLPKPDKQMPTKVDPATGLPIEDPIPQGVN